MALTEQERSAMVEQIFTSFIKAVEERHNIGLTPEEMERIRQENETFREGLLTPGGIEKFEADQRIAFIHPLNDGRHLMYYMSEDMGQRIQGGLRVGLKRVTGGAYEVYEVDEGGSPVRDNPEEKCKLIAWPKEQFELIEQRLQDPSNQ